MHQWVENHATDADHLCDIPDVAWHDCVAHFTKEVGNLVYHYRERTFGGNNISKVESQYSKTNKMAFLCFSASFENKKKMQRMLCFSIPQLLNLLLYPMVTMLSQHRLLCRARMRIFMQCVLDL